MTRGSCHNCPQIFPVAEPTLRQHSSTAGSLRLLSWQMVCEANHLLTLPLVVSVICSARGDNQHSDGIIWMRQDTSAGTATVGCGLKPAMWHIRDSRGRISMQQHHVGQLSTAPAAAFTHRKPLADSTSDASNAPVTVAQKLWQKGRL